jgi:hypothetical protein
MHEQQIMFEITHCRGQKYRVTFRIAQPLEFFCQTALLSGGVLPNFGCCTLGGDPFSQHKSLTEEGLGLRGVFNAPGNLWMFS